MQVSEVVHCCGCGKAWPVAELKKLVPARTPNAQRVGYFLKKLGRLDWAWGFGASVVVVRTCPSCPPPRQRLKNQHAMFQAKDAIAGMCDTPDEQEQAVMAFEAANGS